MSVWLENRKDLFVRDMVEDFFAAKNYFDALRTTYKKGGAIAFKLLDDWIGTETDKGPLWRLKDQCHRLYRRHQNSITLYENLFDWTVGSIFHEAMKLKEDIYQIESYKPLLELGLSDNKANGEIAKIIQEYYSLIEKASRSLDEELQSIDELINRGIFHLRAMIVSYRDNPLLLRLLIDNRRLIEKLFGTGALKKLLQEMFPAGVHEAYILVSENCMKNGWYADAQKYLKTAMKAGAADKSLQDHLEEKLTLTPKGE